MALLDKSGDVAAHGGQEERTSETSERPLNTGVTAMQGGVQFSDDGDAKR